MSNAKRRHRRRRRRESTHRRRVQYYKRWMPGASWLDEEVRHVLSSFYNVAAAQVVAAWESDPKLTPRWIHSVRSMNSP